MDDVSYRMQAPPDFAADAFMVCAGAAIGNKIVMRPKQRDDWSVVVNLWGCVVGRPSVMKSPSIKIATKMLNRLEADWKSDAAKDSQKQFTDSIVNDAKLKQLQAKLNKSKDDSERKTIADELWSMQQVQVDSPKSPRRIITSDASLEKLIELLVRISRKPCRENLWCCVAAERSLAIGPREYVVRFPQSPRSYLKLGDPHEAKHRIGGQTTKPSVLLGLDVSGYVQNGSPVPPQGLEPWTR